MSRPRSSSSPTATHMRSHSIPPSLLSYRPKSQYSSNAAATVQKRRSADDVFAYHSSQSVYGYSVERAQHRVKWPDENLRWVSHDKGAAIAQLAKFWALRGTFVSDPRGNKVGSCGSLVNNALARNELKKGQWSTNSVPLCTISQESNMQPYYASDKIRPGDVFYTKDITLTVLELEFDASRIRAQVVNEHPMVTSGHTGHVGIVVSHELLLKPLHHGEPYRRVVEIVHQAVKPQRVAPHRVFVSLGDAKLTSRRGRCIISRPMRQAVIPRYLGQPSHRRSETMQQGRVQRKPEVVVWAVPQARQTYSRQTWRAPQIPQGPLRSLMSLFV